MLQGRLLSRAVSSHPPQHEIKYLLSESVTDQVHDYRVPATQARLHCDVVMAGPSVAGFTGSEGSLPAVTGGYSVCQSHCTAMAHAETCVFRLSIPTSSCAGQHTGQRDYIRWRLQHP